jgi:uncharacterized protein (TIGR02145 family)
MGNSRFIGFAGFIGVLALLFISCDTKNELPDNGLSGGEVAVRIRSMGMAEGGSESLARAFSRKEPEMVSTPVGDGMLLEMSIKEDEASLRANPELADGTYFRIIAVTDGTKYYSHGDYVYGSGELTPSNDFLVKVGKTYHFICISYNDNTLPSSSGYTVGTDLPTAFSIDNTKDLLWWKSPSAETILASGIDLDITLKQKLAKVSVKLDCDYNKWKIGVGSDMVSIGDVARSNTMNLSTGDVAGGTAGTQLFPSFSATVNASAQTSNELRVMPKVSSAITVTISAGAVLRDGLSAVPAAVKTATLTTALVVGTSYTITVRLRVPIFARSNIYWDDTAQKLTFVPAKDPPASNDDTNAGFQGVFFKWGSLVGVSPVGNFSGSTDIYVPVVTSPLTSTWKATIGNNTGTDTDIDASVRHKYTTWTDEYYVDSYTNSGDIPYMDMDRGGTSSDRSNTYLMDPERNVYDVYKGFRGDICQYLGTTQAALEGYRLPMSSEFGTTPTTWAANQEGWAGSSTFPTATGNAKGTAVIAGTTTSYAKNTKMGDVIFPASGYRDGNDGSVNVVGSYGYYWSGSASEEESAYYMNFYNARMSPGSFVSRSYGFPVRCVRK